MIIVIMIMLREINRYRNELIEFSDIDEEVISGLWYPKPDVLIKLFHRSFESPSYFYRGCNGMNRRKLQCAYRMKYDVCERIMAFFVWINNSVVQYHINEFITPIKKIDELHVRCEQWLLYNLGNDVFRKILLLFATIQYYAGVIEQWNINEIKFFLFLTNVDQLGLIERYNNRIGPEDDDIIL